MLRSNRTDSVAIASYGREASFDRIAANVDDRQFCRGDSLFNLTVFDPGDNAMSMPVMEPRRWFISTALLCEMDFPVRTLAHVSSYSSQQSSTVGVGSFNQERYLRTRRGEVRVICHGKRPKSQTECFSILPVESTKSASGRPRGSAVANPGGMHCAASETALLACPHSVATVSQFILTAAKPKNRRAGVGPTDESHFSFVRRRQPL